MMQDEHDRAEAGGEVGSLPRKQMFGVEVNRDRVGGLVERISASLSDQEPSAELQAALLVLLWCAIDPEQVRRANRGEGEEEIVHHMWRFVAKASELIGLYLGGEGQIQ